MTDVDTALENNIKRRFLVIVFDESGVYQSEYKGLISDVSEIIDDEGLSFLLNFEDINELVSENIDEPIIDIKILLLGEKCTCMYIACDSNKYLINLYKSQRQKLLIKQEKWYC